MLIICRRRELSIGNYQAIDRIAKLDTIMVMDENTKLRTEDVEGKPRWLRLTDTEYVVFHNEAKRRGLTFAAFARRIMLREMKRIKATQEQPEIVKE
jgi:hypothetical protein